jgi:broad specificity phosphatase PhoE
MLEEMSTLYLLRHGQAGPRHDYDQLSPLGHQQTRLLGTHQAALPDRFHCAIAGTLRRQQQSAANALAQFETAPPLHTDPRWNEFDFFHLYDEIAPGMNFPANSTQAERDNTVLKSWIFGQCAYSGESWAAFSARVTAALGDAEAVIANGPILVFTSAAPTALAFGHALALDPARINQLAQQLFHTAICAISRREDAWEAAHENDVPHLPAPLQTIR